MEESHTRLDNAFNAITGKDNEARKNAEAFLIELPLKVGLVDALLDYIANDSAFPQQNRVQAALLLKNKVLEELDVRHTNKFDQLLNESVNEEDRRILIEPGVLQRVKERILPALFALEPNICKHLLPMVVGLAHDKFVQNWKDLLDAIRTNIQITKHPFNQKMGIEILRRIFKNYRNKLETEQVATEIVTTIKVIGSKLYKLLEDKIHEIQRYLHESQSRGIDKEGEQILANALRIVGNSLDLIVSLNSIDLPQEFEDNMEKWSKTIARTLKFPVIGPDQDFIEHIQMCQKKSLQFFNLYSGKYMEDFEPHVGEFFTSIWDRLMDERGAQLSGSLLSPFMMAVELLLRSPRFRDEFKNPASLDVLFDRLILPGIGLTDQEIQKFEDQPEDWINYDLLGHNDQTFRANAIQLAGQVAKLFPQETQSLIQKLKGQILDPFLEAEAALVQDNVSGEKRQKAEEVMKSTWRPFTDFINLTLATVVQRSSLNQKNVTFLYNIKDVQAIFMMLLEDLRAMPMNFPILRSTQLKVIYAMKQIPPIEWIVGLFEVFASYLKSGNYVLATYSSICLESLLTLTVSDVQIVHSGSVDDRYGFHKKSKGGGGLHATVDEKLNFLIKEQHIQEHQGPLLQGLASTLQLDNSSHNLHALRSLYRVLRVAKLSSFPVLTQMPPFFTNFLQEIIQTPQNAEFGYVLMETLAYVLKLLILTAKGDNKATEAQAKEALSLYTEYRDRLKPIFEMIIYSEGNDLIGFVFEIEAFLMAEEAPDTPLKNHQEYIQMILETQSLWERGNSAIALPSLIRYIVASMRTTPGLFASLEASTKLIERAQIAICGLRFDDSGFNLVTQIIATYPKVELIDIDTFAAMTIRLFERQSSDKKRLKVIPLKFAKGMSRIICLAFYKYGLDGFYKMWENKQQGLFDMVMIRYGEYLPQLDTLLAKKAGVVSFSNVLIQLLDIYDLRGSISVKPKKEVFQAIYQGLFKLIRSYQTLDHNIQLATDDMFVLEKYRALSFEGSRYQPIYCAQLAELDLTQVQNEEQYFLENLARFAEELHKRDMNLGRLAQEWIQTEELGQFYQKFAKDHNAEQFLL